MDDLYLDTILELYKHPQYRGWIEIVPPGHSVKTGKAVNAGCGDSFEVSILTKDGVVIDTKWKGAGCAISTVSTDLVCGWMIGKELKEISQLTNQHLLGMIGLESITPTRKKCLLLSARILVGVD